MSNGDTKEMLLGHYAFTQNTTPEQDNAILEVFYELFPSVRSKSVTYFREPTQWAKQKQGVFHPVNKPSHYNHTSVEAIDGICGVLGNIGFEAYCIGNAIKYLWRRNHKDTYKQNIQKAIWYLNKAIEHNEKTMS
jgi:hypothetical protein